MALYVTHRTYKKRNRYKLHRVRQMPIVCKPRIRHNAHTRYKSHKLHMTY